MNDTTDVAFGLIYDFRNPERWRKPWTEFYGALLEQVEWIDSELAIDGIFLSEHHFVEDGYMPSVMTMLGVLAARTQRVMLGTNIIQLPLHHPLRIAEDALTIDALTGGRRFRLGVGNGYRELEFDAFGVSLRERRERVEEGIEILRSAFAGAPFAFEGRHYKFPELTVTPPPVRDGGPEIWLGGLVPAAIDRAGRIADGFLAMTREAIEDYHAACERHGRAADEQRACMTYWAIVTEDPERTLAESGENMMYQVNDYIDYGFLGDIPHYTDPGRVVEDGVYLLLDADAAIHEFRGAVAAGAREIQLLPVMPGESSASAGERLEYLSSRVIPQVRTATTEGARP